MEKSSALLHVFSKVFILIFLFNSAHAIGVRIEKPSGDPPPIVAASPPRLDLKISQKPTRAAIKLFNLGNQPLKIKASVHNWELDENTEIKIIPPTEQSLDQWMIINPVEFTIPPKKEQTIRLAIRPFVKPKDGEHRAIIFFEQQLDPKQNSKGIQLKFRLGVVVYGLAGKIIRKGKLHRIQFKYNRKIGQIEFDISSSGNAGIRLNGQYSIWKKEDFPGKNKVPYFDLPKKDYAPAIIARLLPNYPVFSGSRRILKARFKLPEEKGHYILFIQGRLGEQKEFKRVFPFRIP